MTTGLSGAGFDIDLREAQVQERALARILTSATYELKDERRKSPTTGNVFVEVTQPTRSGGRKFSGINVEPHAEMWVFQTDERHYVMLPFDDLVEVVSHRMDVPGFRFAWGGDHNQFEGVLVPTVDLLYRVKQ
jgi:hypothetical protein